MFSENRRKKLVYILHKRCLSCESCMEACSHKVLGMIYKEKESHIAVEYVSRCVACGECIKACQSDAIQLVELNS